MDSVSISVSVSDPAERFSKWAESKGARFELISKCAYMTGVYESVFNNPATPPRRETYELMDSEKNARVIRHLCMLRTSIWKNFGKISTEMRATGKGVLQISDKIPQDSVRQLAEDGVEIYKGTNPGQRDLNQALIFINQQIKERIGNCRNYFPDWVRWDWIQEIFLVPGGESVDGLKRAFAQFSNDWGNYPYTNYINIPQGEWGRLFEYDELFIKTLYGWHGMEFNDLNLVSDARGIVKDCINTFLENNNNCSVIVDCENADPYTLCAMFKGMNIGEDSPINRMLLVDDVHASSSWSILENYIDVPVEHIVLKRVKEDKSRTDVYVAASVCNAIYKEHADSVILVSSDSDYFGLVEALPDVSFLMLIEHSKCSGALKEALREKNVPYAYIDEFNTEGSDELRQDAVLNGVADEIKTALDLNLNEVLDRVLKQTRVSMGRNEIALLIRDKIARKVTLEVSDDNHLTLDYRPLALSR